MTYAMLHTKSVMAATILAQRVNEDYLSRNNSKEKSEVLTKDSNRLKLIGDLAWGANLCDEQKMAISVDDFGLISGYFELIAE